MAGARKTAAHNNDQCIEYLLAGLSKSVLARVFELDRSTVMKYLKGVPSDGERGGNPIYRISRVAPILMKAGGSGDDNVSDPARMKPGDRKDYWQAMRAEQQAMEAAGDLWHTEKVIELVGQAFKHLKLSVQLFDDIVERETELSERQREILHELADNLLSEMRDRLKVGVTEPEEPGDEDAGDDYDWDA